MSYFPSWYSFIFLLIPFPHLSYSAPPSPLVFFHLYRPDANFTHLFLALIGFLGVTLASSFFQKTGSPPEPFFFDLGLGNTLYLMHRFLIGLGSIHQTVISGSKGVNLIWGKSMKVDILASVLKLYYIILWFYLRL